MVEYLGLILSEGHVEMDPVKCGWCLRLADPEDVTEVQSFIGVCPILYWPSSRTFPHVAQKTPSPAHKKGKRGDGPKIPERPLKNSNSSITVTPSLYNLTKMCIQIETGCFQICHGDSLS